MNSREKPYISGHRVHSEPRQATPNMAVATAQLDDRHPGLALDHGLAVYRASLRWTRHAIAALRAAPAPSSQPSPW